MAYSSKSTKPIQISGHKRGTNVSLTLKSVKPTESRNSNYYKISYDGKKDQLKDENDNEITVQAKKTASKYPTEKLAPQKKRTTLTKFNENKTEKSSSPKSKSDDAGALTEKKTGRVSSMRARFQTDSSSDETKPDVKSPVKKAAKFSTQEKTSNLTTKFSSYQKSAQKDLKTTMRNGASTDKTNGLKKTSDEAKQVVSKTLTKGGKINMPSEQVSQNIWVKKTEVEKMGAAQSLDLREEISPFVRVIIQDINNRETVNKEVTNEDRYMKINNVSTGYMRYNHDGRIDSKQGKVAKSGKQQLHASLSSPFVKTVYQDCKSPTTIKKQLQKTGRNLPDYDESVIVSTANCSREQTRQNQIHFRRIRRTRSERYKSDPLDEMGKMYDKELLRGRTLGRLGQQCLNNDYNYGHRLTGRGLKSENQTVIYRSSSLDNLFSLIKSKSNTDYENNNGTRTFHGNETETDAVIIERAKMVRLDTAKTLLDGATSPNSIRRANHLTAKREIAANRLSFGLIANDWIDEGDETECVAEQDSISNQNNLSNPIESRVKVQTLTSPKKITKDKATLSNTKPSLKSAQLKSTVDSSIESRLKQFEIVSAKSPEKIETNKAVVRKLQHYKTFDYGEVSSTSVVNDHMTNDGSENENEVISIARNISSSYSANHELPTPLNTEAAKVGSDEEQSEPPKVSNLRSLFEIEKDGHDLRRTKSWRPTRTTKKKESTQKTSKDSNSILKLTRPSSTDGTRPSKKLTFEQNSIKSLPYDSKTKSNKLADKASELYSLEMQKENITRRQSYDEETDVNIPTDNDNKTFVRRGSERRSRQSFVVDNVLYASPGEELYISSGFHSLPGRHRHGRTSEDDKLPVKPPLKTKEKFTTNKSVKLRIDFNDHKPLVYSSSDTNLTSSRRSYELQSNLSNRKVANDRHSVIERVVSRPEIKEESPKPHANVALVAPMVFESSEEKTRPEKDEKKSEEQCCENNDKVDDFNLEDNVHGEDLVENVEDFISINPSVAAANEPVKREPKQLRLEVVVGNSEQRIAYDVKSENLNEATTWSEFESNVRKSLDSHLQTIDANYLEIKSNDIQSLRIGRHEIALGDDFEMSSIRRERVCQIHLHDTSRELASISYETLLPKSHIAKFLSLVLTNHFVVFYGPSGTGKSYFARKLVQLLERRLLADGIHVNIVNVININKDKWQELINGCLKNVNSKRPTVLLFDGLTHSFMKSVDQISHHLNRLEYKGIYVIGTVTQCGDVDVPVEWQKQFRWVWLPNHEEPVKGMLRRYLRREIMQFNDRSHWQELFSLTEWLLCVWKHINSYIENYHSSELAIGPAMFFSCPVHMEQAEEWFIDLWNYSIIPYFLHTVKKGVRIHGKIGTWEDPLNWILSTYPWRCHDNGEVSDASSKLKHIRLEDVGLSNPSEKAKPVSAPNDDQHRLMDFLRRLENFVEPNQMTANESVLPSSLQTQVEPKYESTTRTRPYLESAL